ncbi:hypothetical protein CL618_00650 [archaeon]|nr:hypothetical protein [archaeon]|tara:strand:+ start:1570 stop:1776 length:207 start_codon:yes stop_codon:yes gene_type:complete
MIDLLGGNRVDTLDEDLCARLEDLPRTMTCQHSNVNLYKEDREEIEEEARCVLLGNYVCEECENYLMI